MPLKVFRVSAVIVLLSSCGGSSSSTGTGNGSGGQSVPGSGGSSSATGGASGATGGAVGSGGGGIVTGGGGSGGTGQAGRSGSGGVASGGSGAGGSRGGAPGTGGSAAGTGGATGTAAAAFIPGRGIITGVRGVATPAASQVLQLHNSGQGPLSITALTVSGTNATLFQVMSPPALPASVAAGGDLAITVQLLTNSANLPAAPAQDSGASYLTATLTATVGGNPASVGLYGLVLTMAIWEPTLGEILNTLGYKDNVGLAQNNANPNRNGTVQQLPKVEPNSDEIAAPHFQKAGTGSVTVLPVARFSPKGPMPFGWYPSGVVPPMRNMAGTMASSPDGQTSDKARMVMPPLTGTGSFDPGTQSFGLWVYSDQLSHLYDAPGDPANGDYDYSDDGLNSPANVHRTKVYPLHDSTGATIANSYLIAVEEAANGDYQDYVFVLGNARVAP